MPYQVDFSVEATQQIDDFFDYLRRYSLQTAEKYQQAFELAIDNYLTDSPYAFGYFWETGEPYRAFLFKASSRSTYWVIYRINEKRKNVRVVKFLNSAREPGTHGL